MPNQHALLSPSSSERWLHCPRSARLCEGMADTASSYASEGTEAHALCEHLLLQALGRNTTDPRPQFKQYSNEMQEAAEGYEGKGEFECGDWCRFCRARNQCRTLAEHQLSLAQYDFKLPPLLTDDEIASILTQVDALVSWASGIKDYALQAALAGTRFPGWKVVEGRANRRYVNDQAVAEKVIADGKNPYEQKLLGITAMEKLLGKKHFAELLAGLVERPQGKPVLVTEDDKRPEINTAQNDFNE